MDIWIIYDQYSSFRELQISCLNQTLFSLLFHFEKSEILLKSKNYCTLNLQTVFEISMCFLLELFRKKIK